MTKEERNEILEEIKEARTGKVKKLRLSDMDREIFTELCTVTSLEDLTIDRVSFRDITGDIGKLVNLKTLCIYAEKLESLSGAIGTLKSLNFLRIVDSKLKTLPPAVGELTGLEYLDLSGNTMIRELPESIGNLTALKELILFRCSLEELPGTLGGLKNLETLDISVNKLKTLPPSFGGLKKLSDLSLDYNLLDYPRSLEGRINALADYYSDERSVKSESYEFYKDKKYKFWEISCYQKNIYLLYGNRGRETEKEFSFDTEEGAAEDFFKKIEKKKKEGDVPGCKKFLLDLQKGIEEALADEAAVFTAHGVTEEIFREICKIKTLTKLILKDSKMVNMPGEIANLKDLEELEIKCQTELESVHENIGLLKELKSLDIVDANLPDLFKGIGKLTNLGRLKLKRSKIEQIPEEIGGLKNLRTLDLTANRIKSLPESIGGLKSLIWLELGENALEELPDTIGALEDLENLNLSENELEELPDSIGDLENLEDLNMENNRLRSIPESIGRLESLEFLNLSDNELTTLPESMMAFEDMEDIYIDGNNLDLPDTAETIPEILAHLNGASEPEKPEARTYEPDEAERDLSDEEKERIAASYADRIKQFERDAHGTRSKKEAILNFITAKTDSIPMAEKKDYLDFDGIVKVLTSLDEWTFVDRRILAYMTGEDWYWKKGGHYRGFYSNFYKWANKGLKANPRNFDGFLAELKRNNREDDEIIEQCIGKLHEIILDEKGEALPLGRYLLEHHDRYLDRMLEISSGKIYRPSLVGLFAKYRSGDFEERIEEFLFHHDCAPHVELGHLCRIDAEKYEPFLLRAMKMKTSCRLCLMKTSNLMLEHYGDKYYSDSLDESRKTLEHILQEKKKDSHYCFQWKKKWKDGTADFIRWILQAFKKNIISSVLDFVKKIKMIDLDV